MELNFKSFARMMFLAVLPMALYFIAYGLLISLISNNIIAVIVFLVTLIPVMFVGCKLGIKLADKIEI